jgi:hypothetical protein
VQQGCNTPADLQALSEHDLSNLGSFANQVAGLSITRYGGISSFPFMYEVNDLLTYQERGKEQSGDMQG